MKKWLKRIRGALGMGLIWATAWFGASMIFLSGLLVFGTAPVGVGLATALANSALLALAGLIGGAAFSVVLGITEGRRRFDEMSLPRFAGWGAVGGLVLSVFLLTAGNGAGGSTVVGVIMTSVATLLGAGSAAGSLAMARRADDRELLEHGADVADIGLTEAEKRELLAG
jgi:hypothetical protein